MWNHLLILTKKGVEVVTLGEFYALLGTGEFSLAANGHKLLYAKTLLNEALNHMRTARFAESLAQLKLPRS
ncbi:hypothetical protein IAD21_01294 [Abditibacteriota bacterium]|nr:hypothetical protein IAD21_01294 [Abditibacteriota bacterium]